MSLDTIKQFLSGFLSGQYTEEEHQRFKTWLNNASIEETSAVADLFQDMIKQSGTKEASKEFDIDLFMKIEERLDEIGEQTTKLADPVIELAEPARPRVFWRRSLQWAAVFIGLLMICGGGFYYFRGVATNKNNITQPGDFVERTVPLKQMEDLRLEDGTLVTLNAGTTLKYPRHFNGRIREVFLTGEAFFKVIHDENNPFVIHTKYIDIRDLGTEFNVRAYPQDKSTEATLIKGAIEIVMKDDPRSRISLKPYEKATFYKDKNLLAKSSGDSVDKNPDMATINPKPSAHFQVSSITPGPGDSLIVETAWMKSEFVFKAEPFDELALRLERWYGVKIGFEAKDVRQYRFTGTFTNETIQQALSELQMIRPFHFVIRQDQVLISK